MLKETSRQQAKLELVRQVGHVQITANGLQDDCIATMPKLAGPWQLAVRLQLQCVQRSTCAMEGKFQATGCPA